MCALIEWLKGKIPESAIVKKCVEQGCEVSLKNAPSPHLVINVNDPVWGFENKRHCDFLFIGCDSGTDWVVPLELKKRQSECNRDGRAVAGWIGVCSGQGPCKIRNAISTGRSLWRPSA